MVSKKYKFNPDYAIPPGVTLLENIEYIGMSQSELAKRMDRPVKTINEIINGKASITPETAIQLELVLGLPASFWNNLEKNYRSKLAEIDETNRILADKEWLKSFPIKDLKKHKLISEKEEITETFFEVLKFFGVSNQNSFNTYWTDLFCNSNINYRKSNTFESSEISLMAWLRAGELKAQKLECKPFNKNTFESLLVEAKSLTKETPNIFVPRLIELCSRSGVALIFFPEFKNCRVCGATRWLTPEKALIQLSSRYKSDDHLWFTFFHEAGHLLLHGKKELFIEINDENTDKEKEANEFAANYLIPKKKLNEFISQNTINKKTIQLFAEELGISAGIVVGRLQYEKIISYSEFNDLKRRFEFNLEL